MAWIKANALNGGGGGGYVTGYIGNVTIAKNTTYAINTGLSSVKFFEVHALVSERYATTIYNSEQSTTNYEASSYSSTTYNSSSANGGISPIGTGVSYNLGIDSINGGVVTLMACTSAGTTTFKDFTDMYWIAK